MQELRRWLQLFAPLLIVLPLCVPACGPLNAKTLMTVLTLLALSVLTLSGARLLQGLWLSWRQRPADGASDRQLLAGAQQRLNCLYVCGGCAALLLLLMLLDVLDDDGSYGTLMLILDNWPLVPMAFVMAAALEWLGTPSAVIRSTLRRHQTLFSDGAAWNYYLGYWAVVEENGQSMETRMTKYLIENDMGKIEKAHTNMKTMVVLIPTTYRAMLNDADFYRNDNNVSEEEKLMAACVHNGRPFGESQVYTLTKDGVNYRTAMELATPMRHAKSMVEDNEISFTVADFEEFARCFQWVLEQILEDRPTLKNQLTLVPFSDSTRLAARVVEELLHLGLVSDPPPSPAVQHSSQSRGPRSLPSMPLPEQEPERSLSYRFGPRTTHV